jgi:Archaeal putative transposase ISC1217
VAQRKADQFFEALKLRSGDRVLLIIDDTYAEKKGNHTEGVGKFFDHSKGYIRGNSFVTSVLQSKGLFIPHKAKMYLKKEDAGVDFKTKIQIALKDIIKPLKVPETIKLMIVFDSWWFSADLIHSCLKMGSHVTCQIKSDKKVVQDSGISLNVDTFAEKLVDSSYRKIKVNARGKRKSYFIAEKIVELDRIGKVKLVLSKEKRNGNPKYYISTNSELSAEEILSIYEDRWNIETSHREANQKLGFKDYQLRSKRSIERFIQLVFAIWTGIRLLELEDLEPKKRPKTIGEMVDRIRSESIIDLVRDVMEFFNLPVPEEGLLFRMRALGMKT